MIRYLIAALLCSLFTYSQNNPPQISNVQVTPNLLTNTISINYDVIDVDGDLMEINIFLSADDGKSFVAGYENVIGDVGSNINSGTGKSITLSYNNDSLLAAAQGNAQAQFRVKLVATDGHSIPISDIVAQVDSQSVYNDMLWIAQPRNYASAPIGISTVKDSIESIFLQSNLYTDRLSFTWAGYASENIVGRKAGIGNERNTIIIDGHFDAVSGSPGADDNGTAVAGVIAASRILSQYNFNHTLKFIGFDKEENSLQGALNYVNNQIPYYEDIAAVLNMEMIGFYSEAPNSQTVPFGFDLLFPASVDSIVASGYQGKWLFVVGNATSTALVTTFNTVARSNVANANTLMLNVPGNGQIAPDLRRSDHAPFWDAGYQALMLTDGAEFRNQNYHTPGDSLGTINIPFLVRNIQSVIATAAYLAEPVYADEEQASAGQLIAGVPFSLNEWEELQVDVYPVPASHTIHLRFNRNVGNVNIAIFDIQGRQLIGKDVEITGTNPFSIDLNESHLSAGIYQLKIQSEDFSFFRKFVVSEGHVH